MPHPAPRALPENRGLAFVGDRVRATASIPASMAARMLRTRNPNGKPNADVLRRIASATSSARVREQWHVDFPPDMPEAEASLYEAPFSLLYRSLTHHRGHWWINPNANPALRAAIARRERYLATPIGSTPRLVWLDAELLPDDSLLVVARDDDFTHGILDSRIFACWWTEWFSRSSPTLTVDSFPFPWPPSTALSALTRTQEEHRLAISRAARTGDTTALDEAVGAAYGWPDLPDDGELLARLRALHAAKAG